MNWPARLENAGVRMMSPKRKFPTVSDETSLARPGVGGSVIVKGLLLLLLLSLIESDDFFSQVFGIV